MEKGIVEGEVLLLSSNVFAKALAKENRLLLLQPNDLSILFFNYLECYKGVDDACKQVKWHSEDE